MGSILSCPGADFVFSLFFASAVSWFWISVLYGALSLRFLDSSVIMTLTCSSISLKCSSSKSVLVAVLFMCVSIKMLQISLSSKHSLPSLSYNGCTADDPDPFTILLTTGQTSSFPAFRLRHFSDQYSSFFLSYT